MGNERKTAIYMRVSVEDNAPVRGTMSAESGSIANQRQYLREYISRDARLADTEILEYSDDGFTGRNMERPGMQKMLNQIRQNRIGCVIVKDMSRFSRDYIEMGTYLNQIFPFMGVDFIAVNDGYDSRERGGEAIVLDTAFRTLLYDLYSKDISVKVKASIDSKCAAGEYVFGQVPLGYEKSREIRNTVIINEREARIVRYIFSLAAGGMGTAQIARKLFEEQIPTATQLRHPDRQPVGKSHTWSATAVRSILDNRFYLGEMAYGKTVRKSVGSRSGTAVPKSDWKVIASHHEPLVTPEMFTRASLAVPGHSTKRKREKHPLTGKIYCGGCGYALNYKPESRRTKQRYFWCGKHAILQIPDCCTSFNAAILEEAVLMMLNRELMRRGDLLKQREALRKFRMESLEGLARKAGEYRKQYGSLQGEKDLLYESYAAGQMDAAEYRGNADRLAGRMSDLSSKIKEVEAERRRMNEEGHLRDMKQVIRCSRLEELTQEAVDVFIRKVTAYKGRRVEIEWIFTE